MTNIAPQPPFLAFAADGRDIDTLKQFASAHQWGDTSVLKGDIVTATDYLKTHTSPKLLLVEIASAKEAPALLDALADVCVLGTKVIAIGDINEYSFYCWLMDVGIFSYLLKPLTIATLETAYAKTSEPVAPANKADKQPGKVIATLGTRGGVGATTMALNLAGIIAEQSKKQVALVDIDPHEGSISLFLDIEPSRGIRDALERPDRIDSLFIERVISKPSKFLSVLSAEESLNDTVAVHEQAADALLKELREKFDTVVLDIPRHLNGFSRQCLKHADQVVLVTELTLISLRDAMRINDLLRDAFKGKPSFILVNRIGMAPKQEMQVADFERAINGKVAQRIPFAPDVYMNIGMDIPAVAKKTHGSVKPLYQLVDAMLPEFKEMPADKEKKKTGLFGKPKKAG